MLTDAKVKNARPAAKAYKLQDAEGLHLYVAPTGSKFWRYRFQKNGTEKLVSLGRYPVISLAEARRARDERRNKPAGKPPLPTLKEAIAAWISDQLPLWKTRHAEDVRRQMRSDIEPTLGNLPLNEITPMMLHTVLKDIQGRGAVEAAHRHRQRISATYDHAIARGAEVSDPARSLKRALKPIVRTGRRPAVVDLDGVRAMLAQAEAVAAHPVVRLALRLLVLTALRPGELRYGEWSEVNIWEATWRVPGARMKHITARAASTPDHVVPLSTQALDALRELHKMTGERKIMFPSTSHFPSPISENTLGGLLDRAGYANRQTAHGIRASFSTIMNERHPADRAIIDLMLAHTPKDAVEAAYNRATHTKRRKELAQEWADLVMEGLPPAAELLDLPRR